MMITVLGVGNIIMQDDGFGVRVAEYLQKHMDYPEEQVQILDGGTLGLDLMPYIHGTEKLLIIDAINIDAPIASYHRFEGEKLNAYFKDKLSVHDLGLNDILNILKITGQEIAETIIIGVKPDIVSIGIGLTKPVEAMIEPVAKEAKEIVDTWIQNTMNADK